MPAINAISVVIPNYNGKDLLLQTIPTVITALEKTNLPFEIIIADDCSVDESVNTVKNKFPQIKIIENKTNSGFSITSNVGIKAAGYEWVLLLNSDVKLEPDYFFPLLKYADKPNIFAVMGSIKGWNDDKIQDGAKYPFFHLAKIKTSGNYLLANKDDMRNGIPTFYVSGANMFLNKKVFEQIGGFNEMFSPYYVEDFELSLRAWRLGFSCYYEHFAVCRHRTSSTINNSQKKEKVDVVYNRNKMYLHGIHLKLSARYVWFCQLILEVFLKLVVLKTTHLKSLMQFVANYKLVRKKRKELASLIPGQTLYSVKDIAGKIKEDINHLQLMRF